MTIQGYVWYQVKYNAYNFETSRLEAGRVSYLVTGLTWGKPYAELAPADAQLTPLADAPGPGGGVVLPPRPPTWSTFPGRAEVTERVGREYVCQNIREAETKKGYTMYWTDPRYCQQKEEVGPHNIIACLTPGTVVEIVMKGKKDPDGIQWWFVRLLNHLGEELYGFTAESNWNMDDPFIRKLDDAASPLTRAAAKNVAATAWAATLPGASAGAHEPASHCQ